MKYVASALVGLGFVALTSTGLVSNEVGDCWKVKEKYDYPPEANVSIDADDWEWDDAEAD